MTDIKEEAISKAYEYLISHINPLEDLPKALLKNAYSKSVELYESIKGGSND